ncbi:MAG: GNAT family N-acetyltransferase [Vicinamibacteraceae bacterium]
MAADGARFTAKELSTKTWPDFVRLFSQGGGWDFCACMLNPRGCHLPIAKFRTRAEQRVRNQHEMRELVEHGRTRGILVYAEGEPVGWCQYGRVEELPIPGVVQPRRVVTGACHPTSQWRITCFVTHRKHRRQGVAGVALAAVVESIRKHGGGWVEGCPIAAAYPHIDRRVRELQRTYGKRSPEVEEYVRTRVWPEADVSGVGPVKAIRGSFGNVSHAGTVSMFERAGFEPVKIVGDTNVLMRRYV